VGEIPLIESGIALLTLTLLEVILGIDNILVISILTGRLPEQQQPRARFVGLALAMLMRVLLLISIKWIMGLKSQLFAVFGQSISGKDLILIAGGLFLLAKAVYEIHKNVEGEGVEQDVPGKRVHASFAIIIVQIVLLDLVFSLDSVITAVGMARELWVMIAAVVIAIIVMMVFAGPISRFIHDHPTIKILALSFLVLIAVTLLVEGFHGHISKGYLYFAMGFSLVVELLNLRLLKRLRARRAAEAASR
jgi:predicted tellurium resistance membrane protein TerC